MADRIQVRDDNGITLGIGGFRTQTSLTLDASNETKAESLFRITGSIEVIKLYGIVTIIIGANHTAAYFRLNDQTAQVDITLSTGVTMSSLAAGSMISKKGLAGAAAIAINNSAGRINEPTTLETNYFGGFLMTQKTAASTDIEYVYTTTTQPTTGVIQFFLVWLPLSSNAAVSPQQD